MERQTDRSQSSHEKNGTNGFLWVARVFHSSTPNSSSSSTHSSQLTNSSTRRRSVCQSVWRKMFNGGGSQTFAANEILFYFLVQHVRAAHLPPQAWNFNFAQSPQNTFEEAKVRIFEEKTSLFEAKSGPWGN
jgi:hypothetical protein